MHRKLHIGVPQVANPARPRLAGQPEASLAWLYING